MNQWFRRTNSLSLMIMFFLNLRPRQWNWIVFNNGLFWTLWLIAGQPLRALERVTLRKLQRIRDSLYFCSKHLGISIIFVSYQKNVLKRLLDSLSLEELKLILFRYYVDCQYTLLYPKLSRLFIFNDWTPIVSKKKLIEGGRDWSISGEIWETETQLLGSIFWSFLLIGCNQNCNLITAFKVHDFDILRR